MEYVEGVTLAGELARRGRLATDETIGLAIQVCAGLEHAHAMGLVHRDVKPQNLLLRADGVLKIADFGIARAVEGTQLTEAGTVLGTAVYLSPEQASGEQVSPAADIYSLGAVMYELIAGKPPFSSEKNLPELVLKKRTGRVPSLRDSVPELPSRLDEIVLRCLSPEPAARPASAALLAQELAGVRARCGDGPVPGDHHPGDASPLSKAGLAVRCCRSRARRHRRRHRARHPRRRRIESPEPESAGRAAGAAGLDPGRARTKSRGLDPRQLGLRGCSSSRLRPQALRLQAFQSGRT